MKRSSILTWIGKFLQENGLSGKVVELYIPEQQRTYGYLKTPRSIFITGLDNKTKLLEFLASKELNYKLTEYQTVNELLDSSFIKRDIIDLSHNWRGRVLRYGIDFDLTINQEEFQEKFLYSYWRLIVTRGKNNYFSKHNITPAFYYPGESTGGNEEFSGGIKSFINYLDKASENSHPQNRIIDPFYDYVILFAVEMGGNPYSIIYPFDDTPAIFDERKVRLKDFLEKYNEEKEELIQRIISKYETNWK